MMRQTRQRLAALIVCHAILCAALGAYGWYVGHIVARIGMRLGLAMLPNIILTLVLVTGSAVVLYKLIDRYAFGRLFPPNSN